MSYTPSSTSSSSCPSSPNAGRQRSSSHVPLLPTSTSLSDDLVWGSKSQGEWKGGVRRKRPIAISLILGIVLSMVGVAYLAQERQGLFEVNWISDYLGPQTTTLLLPRLSENETFSYYTRPLTNPIEPKWDLDFGEFSILDQKISSLAHPTSVSNRRQTYDRTPSLANFCFNPFLPHFPLRPLQPHHVCFSLSSRLHRSDNAIDPLVRLSRARRTKGRSSLPDHRSGRLPGLRLPRARAMS